MGCASDLVVAAAVLSTVLAENRSAEYLTYMGNLLLMVGQNLATMAEAKAVDEARCARLLGKADTSVSGG
ncbi:MAG: hypothetical protein ACOX64_05195 [Candidatus Merdivicinus sp.]|jgi:hypothetical protein